MSEWKQTKPQTIKVTHINTVSINCLIWEFVHKLLVTKDYLGKITGSFYCMNLYLGWQRSQRYVSGICPSQSPCSQYVAKHFKKEGKKKAEHTKYY